MPLAMETNSRVLSVIDIQGKWREMSRTVDKYSRWIIPSLYFVALAIVFAMDLSDPYGDANGSGMFVGLEGAIVKWKNWGAMVVIPLILAASVIGWLVMRRVAQKKKFLQDDKPRKGHIEERMRSVILSEPSDDGATPRRGTQPIEAAFRKDQV